MRAALLLLALVVARAAAASSTAYFDYLYIEANEGGSSGGHVAIRFGDETYHLQQVSLGLLQLQRDDSADFRHRYAGIENRPIHVSRIAVPADGYRRLRTVFAERYLREQKLFAYREALRDDGVVLEALLARRRGDHRAAIALRGAGYFLPAENGSGPSEVLGVLRERIEATYGSGALQRRAEHVRRQLASLAPADAVQLEVPRHGYPAFPRTYSERYRDLAGELAALDVLERALPLRADAKRSGTGAELLIDGDERRSLAAFADQLTDALVRLMGADRPGMGLTLLIGMARLEALAESVRSGRLVLLDVFPPESVVAASPRRNLDALRGLRSEAAADVERARVRLGGQLMEGDLAALERAGNREIELENAIAGDAGLRVTTSPLQPSREAPWSELVDPGVGDSTLARAIGAAGASRRHFEAALREQLGYNLVTHNCVSELFRTVAAADVHLGGELGAPWSLDFIPFVAAGAVGAQWDVVGRATLPSYRHVQLQQSLRRDGWRARVRESNVVTSRIYRRNDADSAFLFFTDDTPLMRPVFGAVNVAVGLGAGIAGLSVSAFDGGRLLSAGLRGVMYSAPELAFVNLRKGSFDYVPQR